MQCAKLLGHRDMLLKFCKKKNSCTAGTTDLALSRTIYYIGISILLKKGRRQ